MRTKIKNKFLAMVMLIITAICMPLTTKGATGDDTNQAPRIRFAQTGGEVVKKSTKFVTDSNPEGYGTVVVNAMDPEGRGIAYIKYSWDLGTDKEISDYFNYTNTETEASRIEAIPVPQENGLHILRICAVDIDNKQAEWTNMPYYIVEQKSETVDSTAPTIAQPDGINFPYGNSTIEVNSNITLSATDKESGIYFIAYNWTKTGESAPESSSAYTKVIGPANGTATITAPKTPGNWTLRFYAANSTFVKNDGGFMPSTLYYGDYIVEDTTNPVATLNGKKELNLTEGDIYTDEGVKITDNSDDTRTVFATNLEELQNKGIIEVDGTSYKFIKRGTYTLSYMATDSSNNNSETVTRTINVTGEKEIIELTAPTEIVTYNYGEEIRKEDFSIKVTSKTGEVSYIPVEKDMFTNFNTNRLGEYTATFTYNFNGQTQSTTFRYMVNDRIDKVEIAEQPTKTVYEYKESLNLDGGKIKIIMASGDYTIIPMDASMLVDANDFNSTNLGEQIIRVKYDEKIATFKVEIKDTTSPEITFQNGTELEVLIDNSIDLNDYTVTDEYDDDKDLETKIEIDTSKLNTSKVGTYEITYKATDSNKNTTTKTRTVKVYIDENNEDLKKLNELKEQIKDLVDSDYTPDSWKKLNDASKMEEDTTQGIKDKITAIEEAISGLEKDLDTTRFEELRKQVIELIKHSSDYTSESWKNLENKYNAAIEAKKTGLQSKLNPALDELQAAINSLKPEDFTDYKNKEITDLENDINNSFKQEDYTQESWQRLQDAVNELKEINDLKSNFDKKLIEIVEELLKAKEQKPNELLEIKPIDKTALKAIKEELATRKEADYTEKSWKEIQDKIKEAENQKLQSKYNELVGQITLDSLVLKPTVTETQITNSNELQKGYVKVGDTITITFTTNTVLNEEETNVTLDGMTANVAKIEGEERKYQATFTMTEKNNNQEELQYSIHLVESRENAVKEIEGNSKLVFDKEAPKATIMTDVTEKVEVKTSYEAKKEDLKVNDNKTAEKDIDITIETELDVNKVGVYGVKYIVKDLAGNKIEKTRNVVIQDKTKPVITLNGDNPVIIEVGEQYVEKGATVTDNYDENVQLTIEGEVNIYVANTYTITYKATDSNNNEAKAVTRTVRVLYKGYLKEAIKRKEGLVETDYEKEAWKALEDALARTENTQSEVDEKTKAVNEAVNNLLNNEEIRKELDTTKLEKLVGEISKLVPTDYTEETWTNLQNKLDLANQAKATGLQSKLDAATKELETAIKSLVAEDFTDYKNGEIATLEGDINNKFKEDDYTPESWQKLKDAVNDLKEIDDLQSNFNKKLTEIVEELLKAEEQKTNELLEIKPIDKSRLDSIKEILRTKQESDYTEKSWKDIQDKIKAAESKKLQSEFNAVVDQINLDNLVLKPVISNVQIDTTNINKAFARLGDTITLSFGSNVELDLTKTTAKLNNSLINITKVGDKYQGTFTMDDGCVEGEITYSIHAVETRESAAIDKTGKTGITFDKTAPVISLKGNIEEGTTIKYGESYVPSIEDVKVEDANETTVQILPEDFSSEVLGDHTITYQAVDAAGNVGNTVTRNIKVVDYVVGIEITNIPKTVYEQKEPLNVEGGLVQIKLASGAVGATPVAIEESQVSGFNSTTPGIVTLTVTYTCEDGTFKDTYNITVLDSEKPSIILNGGDDVVEVEVGTQYNELGATVEDNVDKNLVPVITGEVNTEKLGTYYIHYNVTDTRGNAAEEVTRTVKVVDNTKPVITQLNGDNPLQLEAGQEYKELGATATDNYDGDISNKVQVVSKDLKNLQDNIKIPGTYKLRYFVEDASGNTSEYVTRTINIIDTTAPVITLKGDSEITLEAKKDSYTEPGVTITDNSDSEETLQTALITTGTVNTSLVGDYTLTYSVTDSHGNMSETITRTVHVVDTTKPIITLTGNKTVKVAVKGTYTDKGATASDNYDGDITANIVTNSTVDTNKVGEYTVTYNVTDSNGNNAEQVTRKVIVVDKVAPVATLNGEATVTIIAGEKFVDDGAKVTDNYDEERIIQASNIDELIANGIVKKEENAYIFIKQGEYTLNYETEDSSKNKSNKVTRTITVQAVPPKISVTIDGQATELSQEKPNLFNEDIEISFSKGKLEITRTDVESNEPIVIEDSTQKVKLSDGEYTVKATDISGSSTTIEITIDSIPPVVSLRTGTYYGSATIEFENPDDIASAILISGNSSTPEQINTHGKTVIPEGTYTLFAFDTHGNYTRVDFEVVK